jgi:hypothetical protein
MPVKRNEAAWITEWGMSTFKINKKYSATFSLDKARSGYEAKGELWKHSNGKQEPTGIKFLAIGTTRQNAINNAHKEAERVCPDD